MSLLNPVYNKPKSNNTYGINIEKQKIIFSIIAISWIIVASCSSRFNKKIHVKPDPASVIVSGKTIKASTGKVTRQWHLTRLGLVTTSFSGKNGLETIGDKEKICDWYFDRMSGKETASLVSVKSFVDDDEGFTGHFIRTRMEFKYPVSGTGLIYLDIPRDTGLPYTG